MTLISKMKHWLILPIFLITSSIIVKPADCDELTKDFLFQEEILRNKIGSNDMDQLDTNSTILRNTADSKTESLPNQRFSKSFSRHLFNKTRDGIMRTLKSIDESKNKLMPKIVTLKDDFLKKLNQTFTNLEEDVKAAVESVTDTSGNVVKFCVLEKKSAFYSLLGESINKTNYCGSANIQESLKAIDEAVNLSPEANTLVEDLSKQEAECNIESNDSKFSKCLMKVLKQTKKSVNLVLKKIKIAIEKAVKSSNSVKSKLNDCQPKIKSEVSKIIKQIIQCPKNSDVLLGRKFHSDQITEEPTPEYEEYGEFEEITESDEKDDNQF